MSLKLVKKQFVVVLSLVAMFLVANTERIEASYGINRTINFQGKLVNASGVNVANSTPVTATFSIYNSNSSCPGGGTPVWSESQTFTPVDGIFQVALGSQTAFGTSIDFSQDTLYLGIKVSTETNEMCSGSTRIKLAAVPYAFNAESFAGLTADNNQSTYFTITGGQGTPATLKVAGNITVGPIISPTSAGGLTVTSNGANGLSLLTDNVGSGTAGNISLDVGTSSAGNGSILIGTAGHVQTITIGNSSGGTITIGATSGSDLVLQDANWGVTGAGVGSFVSGSTLGTTTFTSNNIADSGALTINSATTNALTLDSGSTGTINIGTGTAGKTINLGTDNTTKDTINIGSALDDVAISSDQWSVTNNGILTVQSCIGCGTNPQTVRRLGSNYTNNTVGFTTITNGTDNDDQDLTFQTGVSQTWVFEAVVYVTSPAAADMKFQVTAPTGATCQIGFENSEDTVNVSNIGCGVTSGILNSDAANNVVRVNGTIVTDGTNSGKVSVQFGQQVASGTSTIYAGSYIIAEQTNAGTGGQTITLSGDVSGTGTAAITTTIGADKVLSSMILDGTIAGGDLATNIAISTTGSLTTTGAGVVTSAGAFVGPTSTNTINGIIINSGALSGVTTIASGAHTITSTSANSLAVGANGLTNPVLNVDASTVSVVSGLNIKGAAAGGGLAISTTSSGADESLTVSAKGAGLMTLASASTGDIQFFSSANKITSTGVLTVAGAISAPTATNTINNLVINNGALSNVSTLNYSTSIIGTTTSANALTVGRQGTTNPVLNVDASTGSVATGLNIVGAAAGGGLALSTTSSGAAENLTISAKGTGIVTLASGSTGDIQFFGASNKITSAGALTVAGAITAPTATNTINSLIVNAATQTLSANSILDSGALTVSSAVNTLLTLKSANNGAGASGGVTATSGSGTTSTGAFTINTGNASAGTAGNVVLDVGTSFSGNGAIQIGTANRVQTITFGNTAAATTFDYNTGVSTTTGMTITANSLSSGQALRITSAGTITTGGELIDLVGNSMTTGNGIALSATSLTTGSAISLTLPSGASLTTGSGISGSATYTHTTGNLIGSFIDVAITDNTQTLNAGETARTRGVEIAMTASSDASTGTLVATSGLSVTNTVSTTGTTAKDINGIRILAPTISGCSGGTCNIDGFNVDTAAYTESVSHIMNMTGFKLEAAGALISQTTSGATINWDGAQINMPRITSSTAGTTVSADGLTVVMPVSTAVVQSAGSATMMGLNIVSPTTSGAASGTMLGINIGGLGSAGGATEYAIQIGSNWDRGITTPDTTVSPGLTIQTGNSSAGAAGTLTLDIGTSSAGSGTIAIGPGARAKTINIGQTGAGTGLDTINIGTQTTAASNVVINIGNGTTNTRAVFYPRVAAPGAEFNVNGAVAFGSIANSGASGRIWVRSNNLNFRFNSVSNVADYSEFIAQSERSEQGDVMVVDSDHPETVRKSRGKYEENILGVITVTGSSNNNGWCEDEISCDRSNDPNWANLGMLGQVPVKVSIENGPIQIGDRLTTSSVPGVAMKATQPGQVVGRALEAFTAADASVVGKVKTLISPTFFDPGTIGDADLDLQKLAVQAQDSTPFVAQIPYAKAGQSSMASNLGKFSIQSVAGNVINTVGSFSKAIIANLQAGAINSTEITAHTINADQLALQTVDVATVNADVINAKLIKADQIVGLSDMVAKLMPAAAPAVLGDSTTVGGQIVNFQSFDNSLQTGEIVAVSQNGLQRSGSRYDSHILGVVFGDAGLVTGNNLSSLANQRSVLTMGKSQVKVNEENGVVKAGDYLTASSEPGVAMKATKAGVVIGQALEDASAISGLVPTYVRPTYFNGVRLTDYSAALISNNQAFWDEFAASPKAAEPVSEILTDRVTAGLEMVTPRLTADKIVVNELQIGKEGKIVFDASGSAVFSGGIIADYVKTNRVETPNQLLARMGLLEDRVASMSAQMASLTNVAGVTPTPTTTMNWSVLGELVANQGLTVKGQGEFLGDVTFRNNVEFDGTPFFNKDLAGFAVVKKDSDRVDVVFDKEYSDPPIVTTNITFSAINDAQGNLDDGANKDLEKQLLQQNYNFVVSRKTKKGFTIVLNKTAVQDINFSWTAFVVKQAKVFSSSAIPVTPIPTVLPIVVLPTPIISPADPATGSASGVD